MKNIKISSDKIPVKFNRYQYRQELATAWQCDAALIAISELGAVTITKKELGADGEYVETETISQAELLITVADDVKAVNAESILAAHVASKSGQEQDAEGAISISDKLADLETRLAALEAAMK